MTDQDLDADQLAALLNLPPHEAERLDELIRCADMEHTRAIFGYPKDNDIPPPLYARLANPSWRAALAALARDEDPPMSALLAALAEL
jgi:hypothetical protein